MKGGFNKTSLPWWCLCLPLHGAKGTAASIETVIIYAVSCWNWSLIYYSWTNIPTYRDHFEVPSIILLPKKIPSFSSVHFVKITNSQVTYFLQQPSWTNHVPCKGKVATAPHEAPLSCCTPNPLPREPHQRAGRAQDENRCLAMNGRNCEEDV